MLTETEPYEVRRARDWNHKLQLDSLPTFIDKLKYWLKNIDSHPCDTIYQDGESPRFTLDIKPETDREFILGLKPETDDDRRELHRVWMECHRQEYASEKREIDKFGWRWSEADKKKVAYSVKPLETLKSDLESRLSTATCKQELLQAELTDITAAIDAVSGQINGVSSTLTDEVNELRKSLETNRPYDYAFVNEHFPGNKAACLAEVWDIMHYEMYLKDKLAGLNIGQDISISTFNTQNKRVNKVAQDKHKRVVEKYEKYIKQGFTHSTAIQSLTHDFRLEYGKGTKEHAKKAIQTIIRKHSSQNNKE